MAVNLSPYGGVGAQFLDNSGNVLTGGKIFTYAAGTTTPQVTYTTSAGNIPHSNPIILDAAGRVPSGGEIWLIDGLVYKFILRDANDVLIATYDNVTGINSNFVAFTNKQEIQIATAGQTVFDLTTMSYQPGTNSLSVFVDGVNQYGPGAQYAYLETDADTVTFINGLHVGAEVKFTTSQLNSSASSNTASQVAFTGFKGQVGNVQDLAGDDGSDWIGYEANNTTAVARSIQDRLQDSVSIKDFGAVGNGVADDTTAFQNAAAANKPTRVPPGRYLISDTIQLQNNFNWYFEPGAVVVNGLSDPYASLRILFNASGTATSIATINGTFLRNSANTITLSTTAGISVGSVLAFEDDFGNGFQQFFGIVRSIAGNNVTLDRTPSCDLQNGGNVQLVTPITGRFVGASFDGNGTPASPRYGFGFVGRYHQNLVVENIEGIYIGSRLVEIQRGFDATLRNITMSNATSTSAGTGYVVRVSVGNDNFVENISGFTVRHVVDFNAASRNIAVSCKGVGNPAVDFLTHFNGCIQNQFYNCESYNNGTGAYSLTPNGGDEDNLVFGGKIVNSVVNRPETNITGSQLGNKFIGVYIKIDDTSPVAYTITQSTILQNCEIDLSGATTKQIFNDSLGAITVVMDGGVITGGAAGTALGSLTNSNTSTSLRFTNVKFNLNSNFRTFTSTSGKKEIIFRNCSFIHNDTTTGNNSTILYDQWDGYMYECWSVGTSSFAHFSNSASNTLLVSNSQMAAQTSGYVSRSVGVINNVALTIDRMSLQKTTTGNGTVTVTEPRQNFSAATTLGTVNGKVPVYDAAGVLQGYTPVYDNIT